MSPPTLEQEAALRAAERPGRTAIAAGAGAGKTTLMVEAVWRDLERDGVPLDRLFVAAYNRAAAAHLSARLQARFADRDDGRGPGRVGLDLSGAWVGTFHSLAARIVRENPFAAGVDPEFGELDETESTTLMEQALDEALERAMQLPGFMDLATAAATLDGIRQATRQVYERLRAAGRASPRIVVPDAPEPEPALLAELEEALTAVSLHADARQKHHDTLDQTRAMLLADEPGEKVPRLNLNCTQALRPLCDRFNELAQRVYQALLDRQAVAVLEGFAAHLEHFAERYAELKAERGALDYEDLLLAARRVLGGEHPYAFRRVYVDEFQDANALQAEIIDLLGAERTVVVGDGCQAIYGFRHADSRHFVAATGSPPTVRLSDNHRSQEPLLRALNGMLAEALADEPTFAPLTPAAPADRPGPALADPPVEVIDVVSADAPVSRPQEAEVVAEVVESLIARGYPRRDIAVVFRALTEVEAYRAALAARGVPVHLVAGRGFFTHEQVADTLALLALVENPMDEGALVRVLASPYVAAGDEDLLALRGAAGTADGWPDRGALWPAAARVPGAAPVVGLVEGLRPLLRERGLPGLVEAAIEADGYDLAVLGLPDGARRYANLRRLVWMAGRHAAVRGPDLRGFLRLMRTMAEAGNQDPGEATLVDPDLDAVRLTTIHGVKGQEFPAVVIADASHGLPSVSPMVLVDEEGRAGIRLSQVGGKPVHALGFAERQDLERADDAAEERRVTYVAATRAERHLVVIGRSSARGSTASGAFRVLSGALGLEGPGVRDFADGGRAALLHRVAHAVDGPGHRPRVEPSAPRPASVPEPPAPPTVDRLAGRPLSFSALSLAGTCSLRFHLEHERGLRGGPDAIAIAPSPTDGSGGGVPTLWGGTALGDLVHVALAHHEWSGAAPAGGWAAAAAAEAGLPESAADADRAERMVAGLLASPVADRVRGGVEVHAERTFAVAVDGALLTGAIDLMVHEPDGGVVLLDWKTHALSTARGAADVLPGYALQQALYGLAALEAGYPSVTLWWIALEDIAGSPARTVGAAQADVLRAEVRAALEIVRGVERRPAAMTPQPFCTGCPGLRAMCPVAVSVS